MMSLLNLSFSHATVMLEIVSSCINCVKYFSSLIKFVCERNIYIFRKDIYNFKNKE
jgi:hypothetical protein